MSDDSLERAKALLIEWYNRSRDSQHSHHESAKIFRGLTWLVEGPSVIVPFCLGAVALALNESPVPNGLRIVFGVLGFVSSAFAIAHLYFRFQETAQKHTRLGAQYSMVRRAIEEYLMTEQSNDKCLSNIESIRKNLDELSLEEPVVPSWIFMRTKKLLQQKGEPAFITKWKEKMKNV